MSATAPARPIEFRNTALGATIAILRETEPARLADELHKMLGGMPDFFNGEAAVLDFGALGQQPGRIDWAGLLSLLRRYQLQPVGIRNLDPALAAAARQAGLAILDHAEINDRPAAEAARPAPAPRVEPAPSATPVPPPIQAGTLFIDRPLRSGQQVYARGGDLVLLAGMSNGAEVIADGSIHCFGPLRGRALAGAQGNPAARIIATNFGPELVSVAGVYRTFERGIPEAIAGRAAQVRLNTAGADQTLDIEPLQLD
ncbi:putative cell division inhibitor [Azoarcus olearius]|uniref:septum site-determining protein MinC n=1 Tax=Azoarcus sp. (strain BH72) TaxID=418699 RepID=UPI0008060AD8|nr:septum site-determining protein MinC [Azoarcus olearius]ANQ84844.1 putative cell division inhibitor [Azoarcus olearius]